DGTLECRPALDDNAVVRVDRAVDLIARGEVDLAAPRRPTLVGVGITRARGVEGVDGLVVGEVDVVDETALLEVGVDGARDFADATRRSKRDRAVQVVARG